MRPIIYPYKMSSTSAKVLASELQTKRVWPDRSYTHRDNDLIINWGNSQWPRWRILIPDSFINIPISVKCAINKHTAFCILNTRNISVPEWTVFREEAERWLDRGLKKLVCRKFTTGTRGRGIAVVENKQQIPNDTRLFVKYIPKKYEYRVHVLGQDVTFLQQKKKRCGVLANYNVRNSDNGFVFCISNLHLPDDMDNRLRNIGKEAVVALGLDFGAVDVIYNELTDSLYVLEVNTAPGLEGTTLGLYADYFNGLCAK